MTYRLAVEFELVLSTSEGISITINGENCELYKPTQELVELYPEYSRWDKMYKKDNKIFIGIDVDNFLGINHEFAFLHINLDTKQYVHYPSNREERHLSIADWMKNLKASDNYLPMMVNRKSARKNN